ncbi:BnaCnng47640D [Brassica napus]|uniref:BnaCnng47640D protein n=1 Tax=Brassica napus TaxID=3708 RepID=A0A078EDE8_BRANA|nr:BnaCnng47640D [Brassica napus]
MLSVPSADAIRAMFFKLNPNKAPGPDGLTSGSIHNYWTTKPKASFSWLANKLLKLKDVVFPLIKLRLENGMSARFWFDNWSPFGSIATYLNLTGSRLGIPLSATVASLYRNGNWRLPPARSEQQTQLQIHLTTVNLTSDKDYFEWEIDSRVTTTFSTGDVYTYLRGTVNEVDWATVVWNSYGISRHNFHTWLMILDRCPTRDRLLRWGISVSHLYLLCNNASESRDHIYFDCNFSFDLWAISARRCGLTPNRSWSDTITQLKSLPMDRSSRPHRLLVLLAWQSTIYWVWNERNARLHSNTYRSIDSLFKTIDLQIRNRTQSFRVTNPRLSSQLLQSWIRLA